MKTRIFQGAWMAAGAVVLLAGCSSSPRQDLSATSSDPGTLTADIPAVAVSVLGNQAEVAAHGDLARNGREQLLILNRLESSSPLVPSSPRLAQESEIYITRAAILEKNGQKWTEIFHSDEHLKNPNGYLIREQATAWVFEFHLDRQRGMELRFRPADEHAAADRDTGRKWEAQAPAFVVRWNMQVKRYQAFDESQKRFLSEEPTLETPKSILR